MTESLALELVERYLKNHKYDPKRIDTQKLPSGKKAPDFEVNDISELRFYCEVKTPELKLDSKTGLYKWTTTASKLRDFIHKAVKQFQDQDPNHLKPWVIIFTSDNFQLNWTNFAHCIQGAVAYDNQVIKDLGGMRFVRETDKDILYVDLFIWCQVNEEHGKVYQLVSFANADSSLRGETGVIIDALKPYVSEDIMDKNSKKYT